MKNNSGISFTGMLTIVFIVLKLLKVINWSWIWVISPLWIGFLLLFIIYFIIDLRSDK